MKREFKEKEYTIVLRLQFTAFFFSNRLELTTWFQLLCRHDLEGNKNYFELAGRFELSRARVTEGKRTSFRESTVLFYHDWFSKFKTVGTCRHGLAVSSSLNLELKPVKNDLTLENVLFQGSLW